MKLGVNINDLLGDDIKKSVQPGPRDTVTALCNASCHWGHARYSYGNSNKLEWLLRGQSQPAIQGLLHG